LESDHGKLCQWPNLSLTCGAADGDARSTPGGIHKNQRSDIYSRNMESVTYGNEFGQGGIYGNTFGKGERFLPATMAPTLQRLA